MTTINYAAAIANCLWLSDTERRGRALVVNESGDEWLLAIRHHFAAVDHLSVTALGSALNASRSRRSARDGLAGLPFDDQTFDCVVLPGFIGEWHRIAPAWAYRAARARIAHETRRILRTGGLLLVSGRNPQWYQGTPDHVVPSMADFRLPRVLEGAGFAAVHTYFADPSADSARAIIPACRSAAMAFERQERTFRGRAPRLLTSVGLHAFAYPARIIMATA